MVGLCAYCKGIIVFGGVQGFGAKKYCHEAHKHLAEQPMNVKLTRAAYEESLDELRENPNDPAARQNALKAGRVYFAWTRCQPGSPRLQVTQYDEVAIANDIAAATASAGASKPVSSGDETLPAERRLERLAGLRNRGLISEQEYQDKRAAILAELQALLPSTCTPGRNRAVC